MDALITEVITILGAALAAAIVGLIVQVARKYGFDISAAKRTQLEHVAQQGILIMEEKSSAGVKAQLAKLRPEEMLEGAIAYVIKKLPKETREKADEVIHAELPKVRAATVSFATAVLQTQTRKAGRK